MEFTFDPFKSERNRQERGFGFAYAAQIFLGRTLEFDARDAEGEVRIKAIGRIDAFCYVVIYTDRHETRRIISARRANRKETKAWLASE